MHITQVHFRAFDRNQTEFFVTEAPLMEKALKGRVERICNTALLQRVVRYEAVDLKQIQEDVYDGFGKRITPDMV